MSTRETGDRGEEVAAAYLGSIGYQVRERNVRFGKVELDIVAFDPVEQMVVFIEVKTRQSHTDQYPIHTAVGRTKRKFLRQAIDRWITKHDYDGPGRTDIVSIAGEQVVEHLKDIGAVFF